MSVYRPYVEELTRPGGRFEIVVEDVDGIPTRVFSDRPRHLGFLLERAHRYSDNDFLVQGDTRLTYAETVNRALRLAAGLASRFGIGPGDRIGILGANAVDWVVAFWAIVALDAVAVPFNAWWRAEELSFGVEDSGVTVMLADARRAPVAAQAGVPDDRIVVWGEGGDLDALVGAERWEPAPSRGEDAVAGIFYTSGTTGRPKGSANTHRNIIANLQNAQVFFRAVAARNKDRDGVDETGGDRSERRRSRSQDADLTVIPLFHTTALMSTMIPYFAAGHRLVFMPPGRFDPKVAARIIERERVTRFGGVPTVVNRIVDAGLDADFSSVRSISYGGAPASPALLEKIRRAFPNVTDRLVQGYGLTETSPLLTLNVGDDYLAHPGSVGVALPTVELRIVDDEGRDVPPGEPGEIWAKGPNVIPGYWNRPDANALSFSEGWFKTGDVGRLDPDGFLTLTDRKKDVVIRGGENVYCVEVEAVLESHPAVVEAAVVGSPHEDWGEEVKAVVVVDGPADEAALAAHASAHLASFKVPTIWELRTEPLPRNPSGKVLKQALRGSESAVFGVGEETDSAL